MRSGAITPHPIHHISGVKNHMEQYDFLVVGAGLFGATFAQQAAERGKRVLVIDRRNHVAGNAHCDIIEGIPVYRYGPHIFHTNDRSVWEYLNRFGRFNHYAHCPMAQTQDSIINLSINMNTYGQLWGIHTPEEARREIQKQSSREGIDKPQNLEEQCLKLLGRDLYERLVQEYIEKVALTPCRELAPDAIELPQPHFTYDNRIFPDRFQGVPEEGYDVLVKRMLAGCDLKLNTDYMGFGAGNPDIAARTIFTGMIDEYFKFNRGTLAYRTCRYENEVLDTPNYQGVSVIDHIPASVPYSRTIEHKHFVFGTQPKTVITREYPEPWNPTRQPYFPIHDAENLALYNSYRALSVTQLDVVFCGRLGSFQYYSMEQTVRAALELAAHEIK